MKYLLDLGVGLDVVKLVTRDAALNQYFAALAKASGSFPPPRVTLYAVKRGAILKYWPGDTPEKGTFATVDAGSVSNKIREASK